MAEFETVNYGWEGNVRLSEVIQRSEPILYADELVIGTLRASRIISTLVIDGNDDIKKMIFNLIKTDDMMLEHTLCMCMRMAIRLHARDEAITVPALAEEYKARYDKNKADLPLARPADDCCDAIMQISQKHTPYVLFPIALDEVKKHVLWYVRMKIAILDHIKIQLTREGYDMAWIEANYRKKESEIKSLLPIESESFKSQILHTLTKMRQIPTGISTDLKELDHFMKLQQGCLYYIGGRPGVGKTALALHLIKLKSLSTLRTIFISLEMSKDQLIARLFCSISEVDYMNVKDRSLDEAPLHIVNKIIDAAKFLEDRNISLVDKGVTDIASLTSFCKSLKDQENDLGLIIVDYLQLLKGSSQNRNQNREQEVSEISRSLKLLAKDCECPVVCLTQVNRDAEKRQDKRPGLSDLRESGSLEQDADAVMMLYRDDYYNKEFSSDAGILEVIVAKNRHGSLGTAKVRYDRANQKISDLQEY